MLPHYHFPNIKPASKTMVQNKLLECVPNFSEGRNLVTINKIAEAIRTVSDVKLLHIDSGKAANRTVMTFVGAPKQVIEAAYRAIKVAAECIDMRVQTGEHPRIGATDVCPLIPLGTMTLEETIPYAQQLAARVGTVLDIPVYLYEAAATQTERKNLATIRSGEYEGLEQKMQHPNWHPDFGKGYNARTGATVIGVRPFLVAYNINLNTTSVKIANAIAYDVRTIGRVKKENGKVMRDQNGKALRIAGKCKALKAIGWYIEEYKKAQVSMNLVDIEKTSVHEAFMACVESAKQHGVEVTGSELIGLIPLKMLTNAGQYFLAQQSYFSSVSEKELVNIAVKSLGLEELASFNPQERVIEYRLASMY